MASDTNDSNKTDASDGCMRPMAIVLRDEAGAIQGSDAEMREMLGVGTSVALDRALSEAAGRSFTDIQRLGSSRLDAPGGTFLLSMQKIPGGDLLLLQRAEALLSQVDPIGEQRDTLTGLLSRAAFEYRARGLSDVTGDNMALHIIDLDGFKSINDALGHDMGDKLLATVGKRLTGILRGKDLAARLGGDEFAVIQHGPQLPGGADGLASRIVEVLGRPYVLDGHMLDVGASVGVATKEAGEKADPSLMMRNADMAMYRAKESGKRRHCFFEQGMDTALRERRKLENELRQAVAYRQFELYYQPQMRMRDKRVSSMEALLRWNHPERGVLSPEEFILLAEETGIIIPIGEWVLRRACQDAASWPAHMTVAVNVSAKQLVSADILEAIDAALAYAGLAANRLEVEITESVLMHDKETCLRILHALRDRGVQISMDDFGTGYSSLSYLQSFPFDKLKIDRSFISDLHLPKNSEIITAISVLGKVLGMETIAEGVETDEQMSGIERIGCDTAQGYLIASPSKVADLARFLEERGEVFTEAFDAPVDTLPAIEMPIEPSIESEETDLYRLVYYSRNALQTYEKDLREAIGSVLDVSRRNNKAAHVTGALLFNDGYFAQVLEGPRANVEETFERIQMDPRHSDIVLVSFIQTDSRDFAEWSMAHVGNADRLTDYVCDETRNEFDPARFEGDGLITHLTSLLSEEQSFSDARKQEAA